MSDSVNSATPIVTTTPIMIEKTFILDKTIADSLDPKSRIASKLSPCQTNQLSLRRVSVEGGMGHFGAIYVLTNTSSSTCTLSGYPGFVLLDAKDRSIGVKIKLSKNNYFHHAQQQLVSLSPRDRASFMVASTRVNRSSQNCAFSAKVEIALPNAHQHFTIAEKLKYCGAISITPIEAGIIKH